MDLMMFRHYLEGRTPHAETLEWKSKALVPESAATLTDNNHKRQRDSLKPSTPTLDLEPGKMVASARNHEA